VAFDCFGDIREDGIIGGFCGNGDFERVDFGLILLGVRHSALAVIPGMKMNCLVARSSSCAFNSIISLTLVVDSISGRRHCREERLSLDPLSFMDAESVFGLDSLREIVLILTSGFVTCRIDCDLVTRRGAHALIESSLR
jgi:hypothetical protein